MRVLTRVAIALVLGLFVGVHACAGTITVYTALENDEVSLYLAAAHKALPDVHVRVLRLSTGDLAARLVAEAGHPRNDVVWGEALTDMLDPRIAGQLQPLHLANVAHFPSRFRDPAGRWFAPTGYVSALCVNTPALAAAHLPMPHSWRDLTKPIYKGQVVMPDPQSSGTGYMMIAGILHGLGQARGWALLKALSGNVAQYTASGSRPCKLARTGEYPIGVSFAFVAMQAIKQGFPVQMVIPSDHVGYELEASGLMKGARNAADARRFLAWTASSQAAALYRHYKSIVAVSAAPSAGEIHDGLPAHLMQHLEPIDFAASARQRAAVIERWKRDVGH
ncbi:ABC transporter substrate-binding protein [Oleiagrimonas sp. C23AA]|uniref:ABC transporter substrate-binding protein n=1 Tax=Oleiagrimonas sp. C23AA TaxID=2719047 RepID=UPI001423F4DC|nr:ABC transporter substrate-binding protein [Oleiagrimonas sp. C23AA]NII10778.1 ABC transporter substrate-binding protein [Oleiagrimonas sp. C23AA]